MPIIKWDESLTIGVGYIDDQHRQLINAINELHLAVQYGASSEVLTPLIAKLSEYAKLHFTAEEILFVNAGYAGAAAHKKEHSEFISKIQDLSRQFRYSQEFLAVHIKDFLLSWFYNHIKTKDMEYRDLVK